MKYRHQMSSTCLSNELWHRIFFLTRDLRVCLKIDPVAFLDLAGLSESYTSQAVELAIHYHDIRMLLMLSWRKLYTCAVFEFFSRNNLSKGIEFVCRNGGSSPEMILFAARYGHVDCLRAAFENGCAWDPQTTSAAAAYGHLDCLRFCHQNACPWNPLTPAAAASQGHLDCLRFAHENGCPYDNLHRDTCYEAALYGHLDCLQFAIENGYVWEENECCGAAAENGNLACLKYCHSQFRNQGTSWDAWTTLMAAEYGHLECLVYAYENGCPWDPEIRNSEVPVYAGDYFEIHENCADYVAKLPNPAKAWNKRTRYVFHTKTYHDPDQDVVDLLYFRYGDSPPLAMLSEKTG